ncbi:MAG: hypothetical protein J7518_16180 [Nocardioidaceae bacterium]|nr:hypothetical protein [Nocardioidaceae bacterium]
MNELRPAPGRRRAHVPAQRRNGAPAPASMLASMWSAVSSVHTVLEPRRRYFETTEADDQLGEQLTVLPIVDGWHPVTVAEAEELTYLLGVYAEVGDQETRDEAARMVSVLIYSMAEERAARRPGSR